MFAQMKHLAIVSSNVNLEGDFYSDVFALKRSGLARAGGAVVVRDGYVGLNLNPRAPGRQAGFDHFGFEVQDVDLVFTELEKPAGDPNHYLSDGRVTLAILPWQITDFEGSGIERPALDHIGFKVESMAAFKADLEKHTRQSAAPADNRPEKNPEREARQKLFAKCCFA